MDTNNKQWNLNFKSAQNSYEFVFTAELLITLDIP